MRNLFLLFFILFSVVSCTDGSDDDGNTTPVDNAEINVDVPDVVLPEIETGSSSATFTSSAPWSINLSNTKSTPSWFEVSPMSGGAGKVTLTIKIKEANPLYDDRNAFIIINAGNVKKTITVTQKKKDAIIASKDKMEISSEGGSFSIEVKSNIDYEVYIPEEFKWLKHKKTKALTSYTESFEAEKSEELDTRDAFIVFRNKELADTVKVFQAQKGVLALTNSELNVSASGDEALEVELETNIEYILTIPDSVKSWISETQPKNKSLRTDRFYLRIEPNTTYGNREAELIIKDKNSELSAILKINQSQENAIILSKKDINVSSKGETIKVELEHNIEYKVLVPKGDETWVKQVTTKSLQKDVLTFDIMANESYDGRVSKIAIVNTANKISDTLTINQTSKNALILTDKVFNLDKNAAAIDVELQSNVTYDIIIPDSVSNWVSKVNTKALSKYNHKFQVKENTGYSNRQAKVIFKDVESSIADTLTINQGSTGAIILGEKKLSVPAEATSVEVKLQTNVDYEVSIAQGSEWFSQSQTKSLSTHNLKFDVKANSEQKKRIAVAIFKDKNSNLSDTLTVEQAPKPVAGSYYVEVAGTLRDILVSRQDTITTMKLLGSINSYDLSTIVDWVPNLSVLDLSDVSITNNSFPNAYLRGLDKLSEIKLPTNLTRIESSAFYYCKTLKKFPAIPESVTYIGPSAFEGCTFSGQLILPKGLTEISTNVFSGCANLEGKLTIPGSLKEIGYGCFRSCTGITELSIEKGVSKINGEAFRDCKGLKGTVVIPGSVKEIDKNAFYNCSGLTGLTLEDGIEKIGPYVFYGCENLSGKLVIPGSVKEIGSSAFYGLLNLKGLTLNNGLEKIGGYAFRNCKNITGTLIFPESVKEIEELAFHGCEGLTGLTLSSGVGKIGNQAFVGCKGLKGKLVIPAGITEMGSGVFQSCTGLTGLTLEKGIKKLGVQTFSSCTGLQGTLTIPGSIEEVEALAFSGCTGFSGLVIESGVKKISDRAFEGCTGFANKLTIPGSVKEIEYSAFYNCSGLSGLVLEEGVSKIARYAFYNCSNFSGNLTIPNSITEIEEYTFANCNRVTSLQLSSTLKKIGNGAFNNWIATSLTLPASLEEIEQDAFSGWKSLSGKLTIPAKIKTINVGTFANCERLTGIDLPNGLTYLSGFNGCKSLTNINIPGSVTTIGQGAFSYCTGLTGQLVLPNSITTIESSAFYNCTGLSGKLNLPNNLTTIGSSAFSGCKNLTGTLTLPPNLTVIESGVFINTSFTGALVIHDKITKIGDNAFSSCKGFTSLSIGKNVAEIKYSAFANCTGMTGKLIIPSNVTSVENSAFYGCKGFSGLLELSSNTSKLGGECFRNMSISGIKLPWTTPVAHPNSYYIVDVSTPVYVPKASLQVYVLAWNEAYNLKYNFVGY